MESTINQIRNILRTEGITGIESINHCIVFLISRILDNDLCDKLNIDTKYSFNKILLDDNGEELGDQDFYDVIYNGTFECLIGEIISKMKFKNIKFKLEGIQNLKLIYNKLKELNINDLSNKYDIIGTIYEYHLKSGTSNSMRDLGQYYTHRLVIDYIIKLCLPKMNNNVIEKIIDPTMGTGGFLTMVIKYLNNQYHNIDWNKNKNNIVGFDIDENVKNMALLNVFLEIGELCDDTIIKRDSLYSDMNLNQDDKYDIILANEPMGIKNINYNNCCSKIKDMNIKGSKAEPLFLQLFMKNLNINGRCCVIVPDGLLFNDNNLYKNTRKHLIENFNLKKVISLNDNFFLNTGVKTSILFFINNGKTINVEFSEIKLKDDIIDETKIIDVSYDKLKENNYSLFINRYNIKQIQKIEGVQYMKIKDVCEFLGKSKRKASYGNDKGKYPFYKSSNKLDSYVDDYDYEDECLIIGTGGNVNIKYDKKFSCSTDNLILKSKNDNILIKYIYFYLKSNIYILESGFCGSTIKHISKDYLQNIEIPIIDIDKQNELINYCDNLNQLNNDLLKQIDDNKNLIKSSFDKYLQS